MSVSVLYPVPIIVRQALSVYTCFMVFISQASFVPKLFVWIRFLVLLQLSVLT